MSIENILFLTLLVLTIAFIALSHIADYIDEMGREVERLTK